MVDDPERVGEVRQLGIDETTFLSATKDRATLFATGLVDLKRRIVIDLVPPNSAWDLGSWLDPQPASWLAGVRVVATDLAASYRAALDGRLAHAIRVADPFHVTRLANRCLDQVRRRVQDQTLGRSSAADERANGSKAGCEQGEAARGAGGGVYLRPEAPPSRGRVGSDQPGAGRKSK